MHTHIYTDVKYKLQRQTLTGPDSTQPPECVQLENEAVHLKLENGAVHLQGYISRLHFSELASTFQTGY